MLKRRGEEDAPKEAAVPTASPDARGGPASSPGSPLRRGFLGAHLLAYLTLLAVALFCHQPFRYNPTIMAQILVYSTAVLPLANRWVAPYLRAQAGRGFQEPPCSFHLFRFLGSVWHRGLPNRRRAKGQAREKLSQGVFQRPARRPVQICISRAQRRRES